MLNAPIDIKQNLVNRDSLLTGFGLLDDLRKPAVSRLIIFGILFFFFEMLGLSVSSSFDTLPRLLVFSIGEGDDSSSASACGGAIFAPSEFKTGFESQVFASS